MNVFLNGSIMPHHEALIPVTDRGFLFADGVYEVVRIYGGRTAFFAEHMARLRRGLAELRIDPSAADGVEAIAGALIADNGLADQDGIVYAQVTRGAPPNRSHAFPPDTPPTVYTVAQPHPRPSNERFDAGVAATLVQDTRWKRRDIKSIALLPNVLANQEAHDRGAFEALFVEDGHVLEGSRSNLFAVHGGALLTHPLTSEILPGITRAAVVRVARESGMEVREAPIPLELLDAVSELFLTGTTTEVMPVVRVDGRAVGGGVPGPVAGALQEAYLRYALNPGHETDR
ncbi:MAG: aminotransferase class IV [Gemmatimonadota bacterium]